MSIVKTLDVQCDADGCLRWAHGDSGFKPSTREARRLARIAGWAFQNGRDLCPDHKVVSR